jgi:hypothetical protein
MHYPSPKHHLEKFTVFVGGIPKESDPFKAKEFIRSLAPTAKFDLMCDSKNRLKGFVFIEFKSQHDMDTFLSKSHSYDGKLLNCKISQDHNDFIADC